ncbi:MAG TPA: transglycosylase domain-containing protein [Bacteroidia bacterium]|jgi:penicillin-binding protein 1A|nr:transglycosylase domain-containing protein [Bacteroidia bacterium]
MSSEENKEEVPQETNSKRGKKSKPKSKYRKFVRWFWILLLTPLLSFILLVVGIALFADLPDIEQLQNPENNLATVVYSSDGKELGRYYAENRVNVNYKDVDIDVIHALVATEDERYFSHSGIDLRGLARAVFKGGSNGGASTITQQLAKMQFHLKEAQTAGFFGRVYQKLKEWVIAVKLERLYTKEEIMALYLNKYDFNFNAVGIKSAAKVYFSCPQDSLKIEDAAILVGMCQNPSKWNPILFPDNAKKRRNVVLGQMLKNNFITQAQFDSLKELPVITHYNPESHNEGLAPYFREYLRDNFLKKWCSEHLKPDGKPYDMYRDGLKIYSTIDTRMQGYAEDAVTEHMTDLQAEFDKVLKTKKNAPFSYKVTKAEIASIMNSAMKRTDRYKGLVKIGTDSTAIAKIFATPVKMTVFSWKGDIDTMLSPMDSIRYYKRFLQTGFMAMEPQTGYIRAWVGGINFKNFKFDHVKESKRQVGSTFKPFVYALAIQEGYSPCDRIPCVRTCITGEDGKDWCPDNSWDAKEEAKYAGKMITLKKALALSINYISAYLMKQFGPHAVVDFARSVGITSDLEAVPSLCLGTADISVYEMVGANSTFANKGTWIEPTFVTRIEDKNGKVLEDFVPKSREVMSEEKAYIMISLMQGVVDYGTGARLRSKYKLTNAIAGKTGTSQDQADGWFMGLTPDLVAGCWVGGEDRSVHFDNLSQGQGAAMALPIWAKFFQKVYADKSLKISQGAFPKPAKKIMIDMNCTDSDDDDSSYDPNSGTLFGTDDGS